MNGYKTFRNGCAGKRVYLNRKEAARTIERYHTHDNGYNRIVVAIVVIGI